MTLNKDQQTELNYLCDREATVCAIVEVLLDHKLMTCDEFLTLKKKHFDNLKPAVEEAVERFAEPQQATCDNPCGKECTKQDNTVKTDNETALITCNIKIGITSNSFDDVKKLVDKLKADCTGNYTFNADFNGQFSPGISAPNTLGGFSTFSLNFNPSFTG